MGLVVLPYICFYDFIPRTMLPVVNVPYNVLKPVTDVQCFFISAWTPLSFWLLYFHSVFEYYPLKYFIY